MRPGSLEGVSNPGMTTTGPAKPVMREQ